MSDTETSDEKRLRMIKEGIALLRENEVPCDNLRISINGGQNAGKTLLLKDYEKLGGKSL